MKTDQRIYLVFLEVLTTGNMATSNHASSGLRNTLQDYENTYSIIDIVFYISCYTT
jgi:hypothetical protein